MTKVFGIIGDPIAQVRSPAIFNKLFKDKNVDAIMVPLQVGAEEFTRALAALRKIENIVGLIVTVPHKIAAAQLSTVRSGRVILANAANALRNGPEGWESDLFDGEGFAVGFEAAYGSLTGKTCAIVGCGGAGSAIALALVERNVSSLRLSDTDWDRCKVLASRLSRLGLSKVVVGSPDNQTEIAINATPLGMKIGDPLPIDLKVLGSGTVVAEVIMKPARTELLIKASKMGFKTHDGKHMLDFQVNELWKYFSLP